MTFVPPAALGPFDFPVPYSTRGIRLTNASNAPQGCEPRGYSYWNTVSNHKGRPDLYVFVQRKGLIPIVLRVTKATGQVSLLRELPWAGVSSGEGSYFSDTDPAKLYWLAANELRTTNAETGETATVFTLDALEAQYGDDIWQAHSSANDRTHSATVRRRTNDGPYDVLGAVVASNGQQRFVPKQGNFDECQIDKSGRWLVIQENDDNRILDLRTGSTRLLRNRDGAVAHSDVGDGILVGEDDSGDNWRMRLWDLETGATRVLIEGTTPWRDGLGHVAIRGGRVLWSSNATGELIDVSLADGTYRLVAPGMIDGSDYDHQLRACFDPVGEYAAWVFSDAGRFDVCLARVSSTTAPPIVIHPPTKPPTGGHPVPAGYPGDQFFTDGVGVPLAADYAEAEQDMNEGSATWFARTIWDIVNGDETGRKLTPSESVRKHRREWREALGLPASTGGSTPNP